MLLDTLLVWNVWCRRSPVARRTVLVAAARSWSNHQELENSSRIGNHRPCSSEEGATGSHPAAYDLGRFS